MTIQESLKQLRDMKAAGTARPWLVMVGGGAKGRWQAGALDYTLSLGMGDVFSGVVGTSVGGLNSILFLLSRYKAQPGLIRDMWQNRVTRNADIYAPDIPKSAWEAVKTAPRILTNLTRTGYALSTDPLGNLLADLCGDLTFEKVGRALGIECGVVAYHYRAGSWTFLTGDIKLADGGRATSAIEVAFPSHMGCGDGGALDNNPIDQALRLGATHVLVIFCDAEKQNAADPDWKPGVFGDAKSVLGALLAQGEERAWNQAMQFQAAGRVRVLGLWPEGDTGSALEFGAHPELFEDGRSDAQKNMTEKRLADWVRPLV